MEDSFVLENISTLCRLCLGRAAVMTNIHDHEDLAGRIAEFTELQIDPDDGLPDQICYKCLFKVEKCSKFRQQCTQTDSRLRQLTGQYTNEGENSNSEENYEQGETNKEQYVVEDSVVMVVDPNLDCDSSDAETQPAEQGEVEYQDQQNSQELEDDDIGRAAESFFKNVFMCKHCDRAFITYQECRQHELSDHDPNTPYPCTECSLVFQHRPLFIQHAKIAHGNDKPYCCTQCDKTFSRRSDLRKHSIVHTGIRPYQCHYCMKSFSRNTNLSKHLRIHSGEKPHVCPNCPRSFVARGDLQKHMLVHAGIKPFSCRQCPLTFSRKDKLVKHEMKHGIAPSTHEESDDEMNTDDNIVINLNPYGNTNSRFYTATNNDSEDFNLPSVPDHITGENSFDQLSSQIMTSTNEMKQVPQSSPPKPKLISVKNKPKNIKCHQCPKRFATLDAYKSHTAAHMGLRVGPNAYQCKVCFKKFCQKEDLVRHSLLHDEMKPFACTQCNKTFSRRDKLRKHERTHATTVSNMPCIECGATFELKADLVAHIKSHFADNSDTAERYNEDDDIKQEQASSNTDDNAYEES